MNLDADRDRTSADPAEYSSGDRIAERLVELLHSRLQSVPEYVELIGRRTNSAALPIDGTALRDRSIVCASERIQQAQRLGYLRTTKTADPVEADLSSVAASCLVAKGQDHYLLGQPCQDAAGLHQSPGLIIAAVSDGVSSVPFSEIGSEYGTAALVFEASQLLATHVGTILNAQLLGDLHARMYERFHLFAQRAGLSAIAAYNLCLGCTLDFAIITPRETLLAGLGEGRLRVGAQGFSALDRSPRPNALRTSRVPPLLAAAYSNEKTHAREIQTLNEIRSAREQGQFGPSRSELLLEHRIAQCEEAWGFYVYAYEMTSSVLREGIELCSDGIDFATSTRADQNQFPIRELIDELGADLTRRVLRLHSLAQAPDCYAINRSDPVRIPIIAEILNDVPSLESTMLREAIQKELANIGSLATACPPELRNLDCDELTEALADKAREFVKFAEVFEEIASRAAHEIIVALTSRTGGSYSWRSMPAHRDDVSVVCMKLV